jgi:hypothetical protein
LPPLLFGSLAATAHATTTVTDTWPYEVVSYADLNLANEVDAAILLSASTAAAHRVCSRDVELLPLDLQHPVAALRQSRDARAMADVDVRARRSSLTCAVTAPPTPIRRIDMFKLPKLAGAVACATLGFSALVQADAVTDWNAITMEPSRCTPGPQGMLDVALVHIAVHDAIQAIEQRYEPYHFEMSGRERVALGGDGCCCSRRARCDLPDASDHAGHCLLQLPRRQRTEWRSGPGRRREGRGQHRAAASRDAESGARRRSSGRLRWARGGRRIRSSAQPPAPAPFSPMVTPWLAETTPFTLTSPRRFRAAPPPALTSERYTQ